ncbi:MAG: hypothetical protein J0H29_09725 [Sphingobacteriales bacterium]|nr:hypothetical protein [Sphingobacteriales bacterium]
MGLKKKLFSNVFFRNMLASFSLRSAYSTQKGGFIPYFQYRIGPYEQDYYLYFREEPFVKRYKNEIFNKLFEYDRNDSKKYLAFHYDAYPDKQDFLQFLQDEISERLERRPGSLQKSKLQAALDWVTEKQREHRAQQELILRQKIEQGVQNIINSQQTATPQEIDNLVKTFSEKLSNEMERIAASAEHEIKEKIAASISSDLVLSHPHYKTKFIQFFLVLRALLAPPHIAKGEPLIKNFPYSDMAAILYQYFKDFRDVKLDTLQRNISQINSEFNYKDPKVKKLDEAMQAFFYE